jgi:hypothetical protein
MAVMLGVAAGILQMGREAVGIYTYMSLSINDVVVLEPNSGSVAAQFTVTLSETSRQTVTVRFLTKDGSAEAPDDYTGQQGMLTFRPGERIHTVSIKVVGDTVDETSETFSVNLFDSENAFIADGKGRGTIQDNDPLPVISITDARVTEGDSGQVPARFRVTLSGLSEKIVSVDFATQDGSARAPSDYITALGTLTFLPGQTVTTVTVFVKGDTRDERNEFYLVVLSSPKNAIIGDGVGIGTIVDDDP